MSESENEKTYALFANPASRKLIADLKNTGAKVFEFPPIEPEKIEPDESAVAQLKNLASFDWLIFPDVLTVDYFLENLEEHEIDFFETDDLRICVFGEAVADRLRFAQIHADVIPASNETEKIFASLADYIGEADLPNSSFLFFREKSFKNDLPEKLCASEAAIFEFPVYQLEIQITLEITKLKTLLENGAIDEFVFTAPTDFIWLERYFNDKNLKEILRETKISAADGVSFQTAGEYKLGAVNLFHLHKIDKVNK